MTESAIALSIVIPVYNGASTVPFLVDQLCDLSVPGGLEIVLVNDASPDDSLKVCQEKSRQKAVPITVVNLVTPS